MCCVEDMTIPPIPKTEIISSTLKGAALRWFMGLGGGVINNWEQMKDAFLN